MVNKATINRVNKIFLIIFLAAHPLFELLNEHFGTGVLEVGGISAPILLKNLMFIVMIALAIIANFKRKATKAFLIYIVLFGVFIVLQYINLSYCEPLTFDGEIKKSLPQIAWSVSKYAIVIGVIYLVYLLNFGYKEFKIVVVSTALVVVLFTLGTNLLGIDYIAYKYGSTEHPAGNILAWFTSDINVNNWRIFTSRGLFSSGNSLSAFFSIMLPLTLYMAWQEKKLVLYGLVVAEILTMLTLGTRVSVYGIFLLAFATLFIVALDAVINKKPISKKNVISIVAVILVFASFFFVSPFISRIKNGEAFDPNYSDNSDMVSSDDSSDCSSDCSSDSSSDIDNPSDEELLHLDTEGKRKYILKHYPTASIPYKLIYEIYDYEEHTDFWFGLLTKVEYGRRNNARKIKSFIIEDIINTKGGALDKIVGIGEISIYPEIDISAIYYYYGIFGVGLFLMPFALVLALAAVWILRDLLKRKFCAESAVLMVALGFLLFVSYFAGHTVSFAYVNVLLGLICGKLLSNFVKTKKKGKENA